MATKETYKQMRREKTREAADALVDDLAFLRRVLAQDEITSGDVRRMSAVLRRILIDGDLDKIAAPRTGKISLLAPDVMPMIEANKRKPYVFLTVGQTTIMGVKLACLCVNSNSGPNAQPADLGTYNADVCVLLRLEQFLSQGVTVVGGTWVSRREIIKYVANIAHGVHSGEKEDDRERLVRRSRHLVEISKSDDMLRISMNLDAITQVEIPALIRKSSIDTALLELVAAADFLTASPDVIALERYIDEEP